MYTRTQIAELALAEAKCQDARDASLPACKLCGGKAVFTKVGPDESMHSGWVQILCSNGDQEMRIEPHEMKLLFEPNENGWHFNGRQLQAAEREVVRRWTLLNS